MLMNHGKENPNVCRHTVLMDWKRQYSKNVKSPQICQEIYTTPIKSAAAVFGKYTRTYSKMEGKGKGTTIAKTILKRAKSEASQNLISRAATNVQETRQRARRGWHWGRRNRRQRGTDPQKRGPATSAQEQRQPMELEQGVHCNR